MKNFKKQAGFVHMVGLGVLVAIVLGGIGYAAYRVVNVESNLVSYSGTFQAKICSAGDKDCSTYSLASSNGKQYALDLKKGVTPAKSGTSVTVKGHLHSSKTSSSNTSPTAGTITVSNLQSSQASESATKPIKSSPSIDFTYNVSGSTNTGPVKLVVLTDGSGTKTSSPSMRGFQNKSDTVKKYPAGTFTTSTVNRRAKAYGNVSGLHGTGCMKSASFGTNNTITIYGHTSGDISCGHASSTAGTALIEAINKSIEPAL